MNQETKLHLYAYAVAQQGERITSAQKRRQWMEETRDRFANRCLPLVMANQMGWEILCPASFTAKWNGKPEKDTIKIKFHDEPSQAVLSHFGHGVLTFSIDYLFRTPQGHNLWVSGPANLPKDGIYPLEGIVETDWSSATFTMNWLFTRRRHKVTFEKGEPICRIMPYPRDYISRFDPEILPLDADPELAKEYRNWHLSRTTFNQDLQNPDSEAAKKEKWQRDYMLGVTSTGEKFESHQSKVTIAEFKDKGQQK